MRGANNDQACRHALQASVVYYEISILDGWKEYQFHDDRHRDQQQDRNADRHRCFCFCPCHNF
jgi:hypothetical protein